MKNPKWRITYEKWNYPKLRWEYVGRFTIEEMVKKLMEDVEK